jgi:hypothetical protein
MAFGNTLADAQQIVVDTLSGFFVADCDQLDRISL